MFRLPIHISAHCGAFLDKFELALVEANSSLSQSGILLDPSKNEVHNVAFISIHIKWESELLHSRNTLGLQSRIEV